jgi:hypothetical protein
MKRGIKIIVSLLISLIISCAFTFFAFTRLFAIIEAGMYYPNLKAAAENETSAIARQTAAYLQNTSRMLQQVAQRDFMWRAYLNQQSGSDIEARSLAVNQLFKEYPHLESIRLLDQTGKRINFSTLDIDVASRDQSRITYKTLDKTDPEIAGEKHLPRQNDPPQILWEGGSQRIVFGYPVSGPDGTFYGAAVFAVKRLALDDDLVSGHGVQYRDVRIVDKAGLLFDTSGSVALSGPPSDVAPLEKYCLDVWAQSSGDAVRTSLLQLGEPQERFSLLTVSLGRDGYVGVLFPIERFEMGTIDKILILAVFYVTVFLLVLLIANLKQDPIRIVAERMHRFQVEFLREFFEKKDQLNFSYWQKEIDARREEIKRYMKRGLKRISEAKETEIDSYIVSSWNEVVSVIKSKVQKQPENDLARIEMLLRKMLEEGRIVVNASGQRALSGQSPSRSVNDTAGTNLPPQTTDGPRAQGQGAAPPAEEIPELEELEELESGEEPGQEPFDGTALVRRQTPEQAAEKGNRTAPAESGETEAVLEEIEEVEPVEEIGTLDALDEEQTAAPAAAATARLAPESGMEKPATPSAEKTSQLREDADEELEYLSVISEIEELPPLPYERLEELPAVSTEEKPPLDSGEAFRAFHEYVANGGIKIFAVADAEKLLREELSSIVIHEGVYKINEALYKDDKSLRKKKGLKALAQSLLEEKHDTISGIDELYGSKEILGETEKKLIQEKISTTKKAFPFQKKIVLTNCGLDLDEYMASFAYQITDKVMIYAIGELIKKARAVSSILFADDLGLKVNLAIGVTSRSAHLFHFDKDEPFYQEYIKSKKIIFIEETFQKLVLFTSRLSRDDVKFIRSAVFFPAVIDHKDAYLFFGMTENETIKDFGTFLKKLEVSVPQ